MVYILHFKSKVADHAQHYVGSTDNLTRRMREHFNHNQSGSKLVSAALRQGIEVVLADVIDGDANLEYQIKKQHNTKRYCSICNNGDQSKVFKLTENNK